MLSKIIRSAITLFTLVVAYQVYVFIATPLLEPTLQPMVSQDVSNADRQQARQVSHKYQRFLASYFPKNHWTQTKPPKVIESGQVMLVLDKYDVSTDSRVEVDRCVLLFFPTDRSNSLEPPRDAVILEAPQGAKLQFDEFSPAQGHVGKIISGEFPGEIVVHSDMKLPGPADDLELRLNDLKMNEYVVYTEGEVNFRMGNSRGHGRKLEVRLLRDEHSKGFNIAGVQSLEIFHDVRGRFFPQSNEKNTNDKQATAQQPWELTCDGSLHFDLIGMLAVLEKNVHLWQSNPLGKSDQLACEQLNIHFESDESKSETSIAPIGPLSPIDIAQNQKQMKGLHVGRVVAYGNPMRVVSPQREIDVVCQRLDINVPKRSALFDGRNGVQIRLASSEISAPTVTIQQTEAQQTAGELGNFWATGPGVATHLPKPDRPNELLRIEWGTEMKLVQHEGQPVLSLSGRPRVEFTGMGSMSANTLFLYLKDNRPQAVVTNTEGLLYTATPQNKNSETKTKFNFLPDRMLATGAVKISADEFSAETEHLVTWFKQVTASELLAANAQSVDSPVDDRSTPFKLPSNGDPSEGKTHVSLSTDRLRLEVMLHPKNNEDSPSKIQQQASFTATPSNLTAEGNVVIRATQPNSTEQPLVMKGVRLTAEKLHTKETTLTLFGASAKEPAELQAQGNSLFGQTIHVHRGKNRAWIDGPGRARFLIPEKNRANPAGATNPPAKSLVKVHWRKGLTFDGQLIRSEGDVLVDGPGIWLRTEVLEATLTKAIQFDDSSDLKQAELALIRCQGAVIFDHRGKDQTGQTSHERVQLASLVIDQRTGAVQGAGPGWVQSVHLANKSPQAAADSSKPDSPLRFLRVGFHRQIVGNYLQKEMQFLGRVKCVVGPVDSWEQQIDIDQKAELPDGTLVLTTDSLKVNEDPNAARKTANNNTRHEARGAMELTERIGPLELLAEGNVMIEGGSTERGAFTAEANRVSYNQSKDMFILKGDAAREARLWYQKTRGGQYFRNGANYIQYSRSTGEAKATGLRYFDFTPPATATRASRPSGR